MFKFLRKRKKCTPVRQGLYPYAEYALMLRGWIDEHTCDLRIVKLKYEPSGSSIHITLLMAAIPAANLDVVVVSPSGATIASSIVSGEDGKFAYEFAATEVGSYKLAVSFAGNEKFLATSAEVEIVVIPLPVESQITLSAPTGSVFVGGQVSVNGTFGTPEAPVAPAEPEAPAA